MKNNILENFPVLSSKEKNIINEKYFEVEIRPLTTIKGSYENIDYEVNESFKNMLYLQPGKINWGCTTNDLKVEIKAKFRGVKVLYEDFDLASREDTIGLGVMVSCKKSRFVRYIKLDPMFYLEDEYYTSKIITVSEEGEYNLSSDIKLKFFLYLEKAEDMNDNFHARIPGTKLGDIKEVQLIFEGDGPEISFVEVENKDKPFIYYSIDWNDLNDDFNSTCKIMINKANKNYKKIKIDEIDNEYLNYIMIDTYTNFFYEILFKSLDDYDEEEEYDISSVGRVVYTYRKNLNVNKEIIEERMQLYEILKQFIEKQITK